MDLADVAALRSPRGRALLASLGRYDGADALAVGERLRRSHPPELVAAAMTQARLRTRARAWLGPDADRMLFTPDGSEQATRAGVAQRHAGRYVAAEAGRVADLCCGVGGDLMALARAGLDVTGVDRDPVTCAVAAANAEQLGLAERVRVLCADVTSTDLAPYDAVFCDPARRRGGRRTLHPDAWSPPWPFVAALLTGERPAGVKAAPGLAHHLVPAGVEAEWVSVGGDVVEAALWSGGLATGVRRRATLLPSGTTVTGPAIQAPPPVRPVRRWLYEPDGAVIRAGLVGAVVAAVDGSLLDPTIAYVCADRRVETALAATYEVLDALPFQLKRLRTALRTRGVGDVVVKRRGSAVEPDQLRRRLRLPRGGERVTLVLTRVAGAPWALVARPAGGSRG